MKQRGKNENRQNSKTHTHTHTATAARTARTATTVKGRYSERPKQQKSKRAQEEAEEQTRLDEAEEEHARLGHDDAHRILEQVLAVRWTRRVIPSVVFLPEAHQHLSLRLSAPVQTPAVHWYRRLRYNATTTVRKKSTVHACRTSALSTLIPADIRACNHGGLLARKRAEKGP